MPRLTKLVPLAALAVLAAASTGVRAQDATGAGAGAAGTASNPLRVGQACGNADVCESGAICTANLCVKQESLADVVPNGQNNRCSVDDCCPEGTACVNFYATDACWRIDAIPSPLNTLECRGEARSINSTSAASGTFVTAPSTLEGIGDACDEATCCSGNLVCLTANRVCAPDVTGVSTIDCGGNGTQTGTGANTGNNGSGGAGGLVSSSLGQSCSATVCCESDLVCYESANICGPRIPGVGTVGCNGATNEPSTSTGSSCSVTSPCTAGQTCVANRCINDAVVPSGVKWGLGNECSADVCCPNEYECLANGNRCGERISSAFSIVTCAANGGGSWSGQTITSDGTIPPVQPVAADPNDDGNGAASLAVNAKHFALLGVGALVAALLA